MLNNIYIYKLEDVYLELQEKLFYKMSEYLGQGDLGGRPNYVETANRPINGTQSVNIYTLCQGI
jgi:hypothetical protein